MNIKQSINYNKYFGPLLLNIFLLILFFDYVNYGYFYISNSTIIEMKESTCNIILKNSDIINKINETSLILICALLSLITILLISLIMKNIKIILISYKNIGLSINNSMFINFINFILLFLLILIINYVVNKTSRFLMNYFGKINIYINHAFLFFLFFTIVIVLITIYIKKLISNK